MTIYIIPAFILLILIYACFKRVNIFKAFTKGAAKAPPLLIGILPTLIAIFVMLQLMTVSGVDQYLANALSPVLSVFGIPRELSLLIIMRPFSGGGSLAVVQDIMTTYGADSYVARAASVIMASSDTLLYICTLYLTGTNVKKLGFTLPIGFFMAVLGSIVACLVCLVF